MPVDCYCDAYDSEWYFAHHQDFAPLATTRRQRCYACRVLIGIGEDCGAIQRWRNPFTEIEERIHGDEVPLANRYLCEECFGLLLSVEQAGGCVTLCAGEPLKDAVREWREELAAQARTRC